MNRYLAINIEGKIGQSTVISKGLRPLLLKFKLYLFLNLFLNVIKSNKRLTYISHPQYKEDSDVNRGPSWSGFYASWIFIYLCNQCLSPLMLWVRIPLRWDVLVTTLCDKVCLWLVAPRWFSPSTPVSYTNKMAATI